MIRSTVWKASVLLLALMTSPAVVPQAPSAQARFGRVIELYRGTLVLLDEAGKSGDPARRELLASSAKNIYREKQQLLSRIESDVLRDGASARELADFLEQGRLEDVDRLAFDEVVDSVLDSGRGGLTAESQRSRGRFQGLRSALDRDRTALRDEAKGLRGAAGREGRDKWSAYIERIRSGIDLEELLREFAGDAPSTERGGSPYGEHALFGYGLPKKHVVLTFDDGPHARYTDAVLDTLDQHGVTAYFFTVGQNLGTIEDDGTIQWTGASVRARLAFEAGHILANHTFSHRQMTKLDDETREEEVDRTNRLLHEITGAEPNWFRPPYGATSRALTDEYAQSGLTSVLWNVDSWDWGDPVAESIVERVVSLVEETGRGILLFHDIHKQTAEALPAILDALVARGYVFSTLEGAPAAEPKPLATLAAARSLLPKETVAEPKGEDPHRSFAVIVGINDYESWPKLRYAVHDASALETLLVERFGFPRERIFRLFDREATREHIVEVLAGKLADPALVGPHDRVLVFFAGHGATRKLPSGKELGYIVPVDADFRDYPTRSISMTELKDFSELIAAKQVYFIMDSCYSGLALTRGAGGRYLEEVSERRARQILTAGGADEAVADNGPGGHSIFTWTLLQGLEGLADLDGNGLLTASELGAFAAPIVSKFSSQTPVFGNLEGSEGGEFVFELELENLSAASRALDEEANAMGQELEGLKRELASKLERNLELARTVGKLQEDLSPEELALSQANRHHALGLQYFRESRYQPALDELGAAVELNPNNPTIVNNYGFVLYRAGRVQESVPWLRRAISLDPGRAVAYVNLADALRDLGESGDAASFYRKYLELWPETPRRDEIEKLLREALTPDGSAAARASGSGRVGRSW